ncbi:MAG: fibronectin type III domain-containing protein [Patescibacteria group bacterium]|nr:fibronectin type III domain-containing protein [Patescibacteria group bacterium]
MKNTNFSKLMGLAIICLAFSAFFPYLAKAETADCGNDPVYTRNFNAKTITGARVRSIACMTGSDILTVLPAGTVVPVIAETDGWYKVKAGDKIGWVGSQLMAKVSDDTAASAVPASAATVSTPKATGLVGISENNYSRLKAKNKSLIKLLKNKIVLRVHSRGEAYFVKANGDLTYLKDSKEVKKYYKSEKKENASSKDEKTSQDSKSESNVTGQTSSSGQIKLTGILTDPGKVALSWTASGVDASKGFKVVISENANPVYPGNDYHYLADPNAKQDVWSGLDDKVYHFRVCQYLGGACGVYSNDLAMIIATNGSATGNILPGSIKLNILDLGNGTVSLTWGLTDMTSPKGFKVVMSENPNPVYPGNDYHYLADPNQVSDNWTGLKPGTTYHFRVCEYLGGYCGTYSNDATVIAK